MTPGTTVQLASPSLEDKLEAIHSFLGESDDLIVRRFRVFGEIEAAAIFMASVVDHILIHEAILKPLMNIPPQLNFKVIDLKELPDVLLKDCLLVTGGMKETEAEKLLNSIMQGSTVLLIDGAPESLVLQTRKIEKRGIEQPQTEQVIRGAREGFVEVLETNLSLLRGRLQSNDLRIKISPIGRRTRSRVAVCYIEGIVNPQLVDEALSRLSKIDTDAIIDAGYIEQFIEDHPMSPFPQIQSTERPDKTAAALIEGRVAIMVDNSPFALIIPTVFAQFYQTLDDYTERFMIASLIRMVRLIALIFSLITPALYVSVISFNPELLPTDFAVAVAGGRAGVPFPAFIEVLIIEVSMEVLREATIRLPQMIGGALSIVGVLVIGQAAVSAGFCSPITVVIVALTTIGSFATPAYNAAIALRMLRFPLIFLAGTFGLYGVMIGLILIVNHLLSLESFGVPYVAPIVPGSWQGIKDSLMRGPLWWIPNRPSYLHPVNKRRQAKKTAKSPMDSAFKGPTRKENP
nr:spore germination protein [Paenibacillus caui]